MLDDLPDRLEGVRRSGAGWTARCPAHDDRRASLSVGRGDDGRWLLKCHAGCAFDAIVAALGIDAGELFPDKQPHQPPDRRIIAVYDYAGVFEVVRYEPKDFRQRRPDGQRGYLWNLNGVTPRLFHLNDLAGLVLLHLLRCDPRARPHARMLAAALDCAGRRYQDLRAALDVLLDAGHVDPTPSGRTQRHTGSVGTPSPAKDVSAPRPSAIVMFPFPRFHPRG